MKIKKKLLKESDWKTKYSSYADHMKLNFEVRSCFPQKWKNGSVLYRFSRQIHNSNLSMEVFLSARLGFCSEMDF